MGQLVLGVYYLVALVAIYIVLKAYRKNVSIGKKIGRVMLAAVFVIIFYSFNFWTDNYRFMSLGNSLSFIMLDVMLISFYDYLIDFLEYKKPILKTLRLAMMCWVVLDGVAAIENVFFEIMAEYRRIEFYDTEILEIVPKLPFHFHIIFLVVVFVLIIGIIGMKMREMPRSYWKKYYCLLVGLALAFMGNVIHLNDWFNFKADVSVVTYGVLGILMYYNTFHYNVRINRKITRNLILDYLPEPILLFDYEGKLSEVSKGIYEILPASEIRMRMDIDSFLVENNIDGIHETDRDQNLACSFMVDGMERNYDCVFRCMRDKKNRVVGYMILFHDITSVQAAYYALEKSVTYDTLTGLFNKQSLYAQLPQWEDDRYWPVSVCVCNIDNLKQLNKEYGVAYGDSIIKQLAWSVKKYAGINNFIAREDDGDIVVFLEMMSEAEAAAIFEKIGNEISEADKEKDISVEYGIVVIDSDAFSVKDALNEAKSSMRRKKMLKNASASSSLVDSLKQALCESDFQTEEHVERTKIMAARLGKEMELSDTDIAKLQLLAVLHDIGKVAIPQHVLKKRSKLTAEERTIIEEHTVKGYRIAKSSPELADIADCILSHHEKWDGTGYPNSLKGEEIPLLARIISAVDSHDVMVNDRPYHKAMAEKPAIEELKRCAGTQFDPHVIEVFVQLLEREELEA